MQRFNSIKSCISLAVRNILVFPHYTHAYHIFLYFTTVRKGMIKSDWWHMCYVLFLFPSLWVLLCAIIINIALDWIKNPLTINLSFTQRQPSSFLLELMWIHLIFTWHTESVWGALLLPFSIKIYIYMWLSQEVPAWAKALPYKTIQNQ